MGRSWHHAEIERLGKDKGIAVDFALREEHGSITVKAVIPAEGMVQLVESREKYGSSAGADSLLDKLAIMPQS